MLSLLRRAPMLVLLLGFFLAPSPVQAEPTAPCPTDSTSCSEHSSGVADLSPLNEQEDVRLGNPLHSVAGAVAWLSAAVFLTLGMANILYLATRRRVTGWEGFRKALQRD